MRPAGAVHAGQGDGGSHARADAGAAPASRRSAARTSCPEKQLPKAPRHPDQPGPCTTCSPSTRKPLLFGEDVAQKGGVYTVTKGLHKAFGNKRVFNTLLDETMILGHGAGLRQHGHAADPGDPVPRVSAQRHATRSAARAVQPAVLQQRPVPQPDGRAHRRARLPARLRRAFPQRQLDDPRCATSPAWWSAAHRAATTRR